MRKDLRSAGQGKAERASKAGQGWAELGRAGQGGKGGAELGRAWQLFLTDFGELPEGMTVKLASTTRAPQRQLCIDILMLTCALNAYNYVNQA